MDLLQLGGILAGLVSGAITKKISKKKGSTAHKLLSPVAAVVGAAGAAAAAGAEGQELMNAGVEAGAAAVFGHSVYRGAKEVAKNGR